MTVRVTSIQRLIGTAAQRGAMTDAQRNALNPGSTFFETDTGLLYVLNNATPQQWGLKSVSVTSADPTIPEYQWLSTDAEPVLAAGDRAFGIEVDAVTHELTVNYWAGAGWQEVS